LNIIKKELSSLFNKNLKNISLNSEQLAVSVVDRFQGLEKDIIIFDLVRSGQETLGFLAVANRLNVALSRQKRLLIIIGNRHSILNAKAPKELEKNGQTPAIKKYLKALKEEWIVNHIDQIF
jgi:superfamily I DNA and/or RNA helicase